MNIDLGRAVALLRHGVSILTLLLVAAVLVDRFLVPLPVSVEPQQLAYLTGAAALACWGCK